MAKKNLMASSWPYMFPSSKRTSFHLPQIRTFASSFAYVSMTAGEKQLFEFDNVVSRVYGSTVSFSTRACQVNDSGSIDF